MEISITHEHSFDTHARGVPSFEIIRSFARPRSARARAQKGEWWQDDPSGLKRVPYFRRAAVDIVSLSVAGFSEPSGLGVTVWLICIARLSVRVVGLSTSSVESMHVRTQVS